MGPKVGIREARAEGRTGFGDRPNGAEPGRRGGPGTYLNLKQDYQGHASRPKLDCKIWVGTTYKRTFQK